MINSDDEYEEFVATARSRDSSPSPPSTPCPQQVLGKRTRVADEDDEHDIGGPASAATPMSTPAGPAPPVNKNYVAYAQRMATQKRLRAEDAAELLGFVSDTPLGREVRLYATLLAMSRRMEAIVQSQPAWTPSDDLEINIKTYAFGILLSGHLESYKGKVVTEHLAKILKRKRFDLPAGIEKNPANWKKVLALIESAFTQHRSTIKKEIVKSVKGSAEDHQPIYELATTLCEKSMCTPSLPLCARLAFLRHMYLKNPKREMWDEIDKTLASVRRKSGDDMSKITRYFRGILTKDRELHGPQENDDFDAAVSKESNDWQQEIDSIISNVNVTGT